MSKFVVVEECHEDDECPGKWYFQLQTMSSIQWTDTLDQATVFNSEWVANTIRSMVPRSKVVKLE